MASLSDQEKMELLEPYLGEWKCHYQSSPEKVIKAAGVKIPGFLIKLIEKVGSRFQAKWELIDEATLKITVKSAFMTRSNCFPLDGSPTEITHFGIKTKAASTFEDGKLVTNVLESSLTSKKIKTIRQIIEGDLVSKSYVDGEFLSEVIMKRVQSSK